MEQFSLIFEENFWRSPRVASSRNFARARVRISPAPQSRSPKLETTRSLLKSGWSGSCSKLGAIFGPCACAILVLEKSEFRGIIRSYSKCDR